MAVKKRIPKPKKPWEGSQVLDLRLRIPCDVVMMCKLANVKPDDLLSSFLSCLGVEKDDKNPQAAKDACIDFFVSYGHGIEYYSEKELRDMFQQMAMVNNLWPDNGSSKLIDVHAHWRKKYWKHLFKKWYWKVRRNKLSTKLP
jgi:hypothetical protein